MVNSHIMYIFSPFIKSIDEFNEKKIQISHEPKSFNYRR